VSGGEREVCVLAGDLEVVLGVWEGVVVEEASVWVCDIVVMEVVSEARDVRVLHRSLMVVYSWDCISAGVLLRELAMSVIVIIKF
jgi:hypothetical protein